MSSYPEDCRYTKDHEWARVDGGVVRVGITAYAVDQLGDITLVDVSAPGTAVASGERFGDIESVKTVSELFSPIGGTVASVNVDLEGSPELVNEDPYGAGWLMTVTPSNTREINSLMTAADYEAYLGTLEG